MKIFIIFCLTVTLSATEYLITVDVHGNILKYKIRESIEQSSEAIQIENAKFCDIPPSCEYCLVLSADQTPDKTRLHKVDLGLSKASNSIDIPNTSGASISTSYDSKLAFFTDLFGRKLIQRIDLSELQILDPVPNIEARLIGKFSKKEKGDYFAISKNPGSATNSFFRIFSDLQNRNIQIGNCSLSEFCIDSNEKFCYVTALGNGNLSPAIVKIDTSSDPMSFIRVEKSSYRSMGQIQITSDNRHLIFTNIKFPNCSLIKSPTDSLEDLASVENDIVFKNQKPNALILSTKGNRAIFATTNISDNTYYLSLIDIENWRIIHTYQTSAEIVSMTSYIPKVANLQIFGFSRKEEFLAYIYYENQLSWVAPAGIDLSEVSYFRIIYNSEVVREINKTDPWIFHECVLKSNKQMLYKVQGIDSSGDVIAEGTIVLNLGRYH